MASYVLRRLLVSIPLLIGVTFVTFLVMHISPGDMLAPYRNDPLISQTTIRKMEAQYNLDKPLVIQYLIWLNNLSPFGFPPPPVPEREPPAQGEQPASAPASAPMTQENPGTGSEQAASIPAGVPAAPKKSGYFRRVGVDGQWHFNWPRFKWPNLGQSFTQKRPVAQVIKSRAFNTIILSLVSMVLTWLIALPLGILAAVRQNRLADRLAAFFAFIGMSMPGFFLCLLFLYGASYTNLLPVGGITSPGYESYTWWRKTLDIGWHMIIPTVVIAIGSLAGLQRIMRGNMLEVLRMQYITTARAKGLPESRVIYRHALRNAINPMLTIFGYQLSGILSGAALIEIVIGWPGLGMLMLEAVRAQDIFLVMGDLLIGAVLLIAGNLIADLLLAIADPRISYS